MKVLIIEDEPLAAEKLAGLIADYDPKIEVLTVLDSVEKSVKWFQLNEEPNLIFSDIQIADGLSFDIFRQVEISCPIIFTTAYNQYAIEAFEVNSVDYLLKPVKLSKLSHSIEKYKQMQQAFGKEGKPLKESIDELVNMMRSDASKYKSRFLVKNGQRIKTIKTDQIAYFFSQDKLNFLMSFDGVKFPVDYSLDEINSMVDPQVFFRINRKFIIHIDSAKEIHPYFKGRLKLELEPSINEEDIVISSDKTPLFKVWLDQ